MADSELSINLERTQLKSEPKAVPQCLPATISRSYTIMGVRTDAWCQIFSDRVVLGITQLNMKVGNWCLCHAEQSQVNPKAIDFNISTVLGDRNEAMIGVYARRITERIIESQLIPGSNYMAVFLGISLKDNGKDTKMFREVVEVLVKLVSDTLKR